MPVGEASQPKAVLEIVLGICTGGRPAGGPPGARRRRLGSLPCAEQAYRIVPLDGRTLALVGTRAEGVYYAAKTLKQLLCAPLLRAADRAMLSIPMADVTDWPDLAERGLWGGGADGDADEDIEWLAERKMNLVESHANLVDRPGRARRGDFPGRAVGPGRAKRRCNLVPIIHHLEQLPPEIFVAISRASRRGRPRRRGAGWETCTPPASRSRRPAQLLADWLTCAWRSTPRCTAVNVWLAENDVPCHCEKCKAVDSFLLQTRVALQAWESARQIKPDLRLRILLTQGSYKSQRRGPGRRAAGGRRDLLRRRPHLRLVARADDLSAPGAVCGQGPVAGLLPAVDGLLADGLSLERAAVRQGPDDGVRRQAAAVPVRATPPPRIASTSSTSRPRPSGPGTPTGAASASSRWPGPRAEAFPIRKRRPTGPSTLGPVGWDVYGARRAHDLVLRRRRRGDPAGPARRAWAAASSPISATPARFDEDLAACDRAMQLARELQAPALIEETRAIRGLVEMLKGIYLIADAASAQADDRRAPAAARPAGWPWSSGEAAACATASWPGVRPSPPGSGRKR